MAIHLCYLYSTKWYPHHNLLKGVSNIFSRNQSLNVVVQGGLGNQLFTFAAGYAIAANTGRIAQMRLADFWYNPYMVRGRNGFDSRRFELHRFPLITTEFPLLRSISQMHLMLRTRFDHHLDRMGKSVVKDAHEPLNQNIQESARVLHGYFRDHKLFAPHRGELLEMFKLSEEENKWLVEIEKGIRRNSANLVALHVRRGDLIGTSSESSILPKEYFEQVISEFNSPNSRFVVFSDSPDWCRSISIFNDTSIMDLEDPVHSMILMSRCDSIVMSRSTLSYWSAWLSDHSRTRVYAPTPFLQASGFDWEKNLLPHWKRFTVPVVD